MNEKSNENIFQTPDLWLATCLLASEIKLVALDKNSPSKCVFGFQKSAVLEEVVKRYWLRDLNVKANKLFEAQKFLKSKFIMSKYMATYRKRMLASCIWEDEKFCQLTRVEQILFIGLITHADDDGRLRGDSEYLKTKIFPFDRVGVSKISTMINKFHEMRLIIFYPTTKGYVIALPKWNKYQKIEAKYYQPTEFEDPSPEDVHTDITPRSRQSKRTQSNETGTESNASTTKAELMLGGIKRNILKEDSN